MSYQRAVVNCRACYGLAKDIAKRAGKTYYKGGINSIISKNEVIVQIRDKALEALEDFHGEINFPLREIGYTEDDCKRTLTALDACMHCDFSEPKIAQIFDPEKENKKPY